MRRTIAVVFCLALLCAAILLVVGTANRVSAQTSEPQAVNLSDQIKILKADIAALATEVESQGKSFKSLLGTRATADALILRARSLVRQADQEQAAERLRSVQPDDASGESGAKTTAAKANSVAANAAVHVIEALRERITDLRRRQLTGRLYAASFSPFAPSFWSDIVNLSMSTTEDQFLELQSLWEEHAANNQLFDTAIMGGVVIVLFVIVAILRRKISSLLVDPRGSEAPRSRRALMAQALVRLFLSALLVPAALAVLAMVDRQIDFAPDSLDPFFTSCIGVWAGISLGATTLRIALQPGDARVRLVPMSDRQASVLYKAGLALMLFYGIAIALDEFQGALHILVAISAATTMIWITACGLCMAWALTAMKRSDHWAEPAAFDPDNLDPGAFDADALVPEYKVESQILAYGQSVKHRRFFLGLEICGWIVIAVSTVSVATGYLALAGFVMGRFIITIVFWTLAYIFLKSIDILLTPERSDAKNDTGSQVPLLSRMIPNSEAGDLIAVILAGVLRVAIILPMIFVTIGPWHVEYGEVNPFQEAFAGLNLAEMRDAVGSLGFATICLMLALGATKVLTSWLEGSLLPYTKLDAGVRYSMTTMIGYGGIILSIILFLSQLGISPQNLTVIASALSVGIGFGLQSIVSNFVSGLIVLTERRIRVGDVVSVKGEEGRVRRINVRSTLIAGGDNVELIVPNTDLITSIVRNKTLNDPRGRLRLPLIVRQDADLQALFEIVMSVTYHHPNVATDPQPTIVMTKPSPIGLEFEIFCMLIDDSKGSSTRSELYLQWIDYFRSQGIFLAQDPAAVS